MLDKNRYQSSGGANIISTRRVERGKIFFSEGKILKNNGIRFDHALRSTSMSSTLHHWCLREAWFDKKNKEGCPLQARLTPCHCIMLDRFC